MSNQMSETTIEERYEELKRWVKEKQRRYPVVYLDTSGVMPLLDDLMAERRKMKERIEKVNKKITRRLRWESSEGMKEWLGEVTRVLSGEEFKLDRAWGYYLPRLLDSLSRPLHPAEGGGEVSEKCQDCGREICVCPCNCETCQEVKNNTPAGEGEEG